MVCNGSASPTLRLKGFPSAARLRPWALVVGEGDEVRLSDLRWRVQEEVGGSSASALSDDVEKEEEAQEEDDPIEDTEDEHEEHDHEGIAYHLPWYEHDF